MFLDTEISIYDSVHDTTGHIGTIRDFLIMGIERRGFIERLRLTSGDERKALKMQLPCATISGIFTQRKKNGLVRHSGYIALDIDDVPDCTALIERLANMNIVAYVGRSVGGKGVYGIIPIAYPDRHVQQWESLKRYFASFNIEVDPATKDVSRLRYCSYDPEARIREDAVPYIGIYEPPQSNPLHATKYYGNDETEARVSECCQQIAAYHTDLTNDYADWLRLGFALAELGEAGRGYFHTVSSQSQKYDREKCDRKFSECLRTASRCGIGYFFNQCKEYGITYKTERYESE